MKYSLSKNKKQAGFSLIELMVVVAVIGILAVIAIPNFQKFQRRAQTVEARSMLSAGFVTMKAFISEWGYASPNLVQIGFEPEGDLNYEIGWKDGHKTPSNGLDLNQITQVPGYYGPKAEDPDYVNASAVCGTRYTGCNVLNPNSTDTSITLKSVLPSIQIDNTTRNRPTFSMGAAGNLGIASGGTTQAATAAKTAAEDAYCPTDGNGVAGCTAPNLCGHTGATAAADCAAAKSALGDAAEDAVKAGADSWSINSLKQLRRVYDGT